MFRRKFFLGVSLLLSLSSAFARADISDLFESACPETDLTPVINKDLIPIRNQGALPLCGYESTATLLDFYQFKARRSQYPHGLGKEATSALSLLLAHLKRGSLDSTQLWSKSTGYAPDALLAELVAERDSAQLSACSILEFERATLGLGPFSSSSPADEDLGILISGSGIGVPPVINNRMGGVTDTVGALSTLLAEECKGRTVLDQIAIGNQVSHRVPFRVYRSYMRYHSEYPYTQVSLLTEEPYRVIREVLRSGNPVQVGLCGGLFSPQSKNAQVDCKASIYSAYESRFREFLGNSGDAESAASQAMDAVSDQWGGNTTFHSVIAVGSKKFADGCKILIRNSYGPDCGGLPGCVQGQGTQWISESDFKTALIEAVYLVPDGEPRPELKAQEAR